MIRLDRVTRQFGARALFAELCWTIPAGARIGLVGPNGAGKTTLLRLLAGLDEGDGGAVHRPRELEVGYLPQEVEAVAGDTVLAMALGGIGALAELEAQMTHLEGELARARPGDPLTAARTERYGELRHRFEDLGGDRVEARAKAILSGLGVPAERFGAAPETLSGGWRMRVVLARLLLGDPGLLLLDEPTNHLDLAAIDWLESFLAAFDGALIVVSHDRYFLNRTVESIVELDHATLTPYAGNYDDYVVAKRADEERRAQAARQQAREVAKVERFIERFRYKNTKAKQVQSRVKALAKLERLQTAASTERVRFGFPPAPRSGDVALRVEGLVKRYGDHVVYDDLDLLLRRGDRVALVGPNGAGKSTLLKLLSGRLTPDGGLLELGHNVTAHYYAQHQLEALDSNATVLAEIASVAPPEQRERLRTILGSFLFHGDDVDKKVAVLSGGEKARLALARMLIRPANLLLLDEPTNHLDLQSAEVLEDALNEYSGTLVLISHDRYFINRVATKIAAVGNRDIELFDGDYDEYAAWVARRDAREESVPAAGDPASGGPDAVAVPRADRQAQRRAEAEERNRRYREQQAAERRIAPLEARIAELERGLAQIDVAQSDPALYRDPERASELGRERADLERRLADAYAEWERVVEQSS